MENEIKKYVHEHNAFFLKWIAHKSVVMHEAFECTKMLDCIMSAKCETELQIRRELKGKPFSFADCVIERCRTLFRTLFIIAANPDKGWSRPSFADEKIFRDYRAFRESIASDFNRKWPGDGVLYGKKWCCTITPDLLCHAVRKLKLRRLYAFADQYAEANRGEKSIDEFYTNCAEEYERQRKKYLQMLVRCKNDPKCANGKKYWVDLYKNGNESAPERKYCDYKFWDTVDCSSNSKFFDSFRRYRKALTDEKILKMIEKFFMYEIAKSHNFDTLNIIESSYPVPKELLEAAVSAKMNTEEL